MPTVVVVILDVCRSEGHLNVRAVQHGKERVAYSIVRYRTV